VSEALTDVGSTTLPFLGPHPRVLAAEGGWSMEMIDVS